MLNIETFSSTYARNAYGAGNAYAGNYIHRYHALRAAGSGIHQHRILRTVSSGIQRHRALPVAAHDGRPSFDYESLDINSLPTSVDWRENDAVNPIRYQGECECCWAFAATAALERIYQIRTKKLVSLSVQHLVDCDKKNYGCHGGFRYRAFDFIQKNGITFEASYPYTAEKGNCSVKENSPLLFIDGYKKVPANNEESLLKAVANQPVSIGVDACPSFLSYTGGVYRINCGTVINHSMVVVGYGQTLNGTKYWILKNSRGPMWGEGGYMRMLRGTSNRRGLCGITKEAYYPIIY